MMCQRGWRRGEKINTEGSPHSKITVFDERDHNIVGYIEASVTFFQSRSCCWRLWRKEFSTLGSKVYLQVQINVCVIYIGEEDETGVCVISPPKTVHTRDQERAERYSHFQLSRVSLTHKATTSVSLSWRWSISPACRLAGSNIKRLTKRKEAAAQFLFFFLGITFHSRNNCRHDGKEIQSGRNVQIK